MFYYVGIENGKIVSKSEVNEEFYLPNGFWDVSEEIYNSIGSMPCSFQAIDGVIVSVEYIDPMPPVEVPKPPTEIELLKRENELLKQQQSQLNQDLSALSEYIFSLGN